MTVLRAARPAGSAGAPDELLVHNTEDDLGFNTEVTLATYTVPAGQSKRISRISVSGTDYAKFTVVLNTNPIEIKRTGPDRNLDFWLNLQLNAGDIIDVKVIHLVDGELADFEASIFGF